MMKKKLLKNVLLLYALLAFSIIPVHAQSFTFDTDLEGWTPADSSTIVSHDTVDGRTVIRIESTDNLRGGGCYGGDKIGEGGLDVCIPNMSPNGADGMIGTDDDNIYLKIVFRNNSNGSRLRINTLGNKTNRDASSVGTYPDNPAWPTSGVNTEWLTSYYNIENIGKFEGSDITIGFHLVNQDSRTDSVVGVIEIDSWELTSFEQHPGSQPFTFDIDVQGWTPADSSTIVSHDSVDGRGVIRIESTDNLRGGGCYGGDKIGEGGLDVCIPNMSPNGRDGMIGTDDDNIYLKIVFRNNSNGSRLRINTLGNKTNRDASNMDTYFDNPVWPTSGVNTEWLTSYYNIENIGKFEGNDITIGFHLVNQDSRTDSVVGYIEIDSWQLTSFDQYAGGVNGIRDNVLEGVSVYPNPATDRLTIESPFGSDVTIYNMMGA